jgi:cobalt-zinc-cadmium efflux system outer membrane protein
MQVTRHTFRLLLTLASVASPGCAPSRELTTTNGPTTWLNPLRASQPAQTAEPSTSSQTPAPTRPSTREAARAETTSSPFKLVGFDKPIVQDAGVDGTQASSSPSPSSLPTAAHFAESPSDRHASEFVDNRKLDALPISVARGANQAVGLATDESRAAERVGPAMTLAEIESIALANNPTLRGLAAATQKAAGYRTQVGLRANPVVGYQGMQLDDKQTDQHTAFVEQEFVTAGKLELNRRVLNEAVQAQLLELETQRLRIITDVRAKFFEALAAQQRIELVHNFQSVADKGFELAELRRKALEGSKIDVLQAKVQKNEIDLAYQQAQIAYVAVWKELTALAGTSALAPMRLEGELAQSEETINWNEVSTTILNVSPELQAAQTRVRQARAYLERQGVQAIPNLIMQMGAGVDNGTNSALINVQVGAPIPVFNQNQGNIAAARAEFCRSLMEVKRIENSIAARLAVVSQNYQSASVAVSKYTQEILPNAAESMSLAELAYKAGETNFIQVLVARRTYFDSNLQFIAAQSQLAQARARVDGFVLSGGLDPMNDQSGDDSLRGMTFSQQ